MVITRSLLVWGNINQGFENQANRYEVRIRQKSQENHQKRANTDTRTEECARAGSQSQKVNLGHPSVNSGQKVKVNTRRQNPKSQNQSLKFQSFQLDEKWFILDANLLIKALEITSIDQAHQFESPLSGDAIMEFVNELGYPGEIHFVSRMVYEQPISALESYIVDDQPITNVDYAKLMWEEFVQAIQTFLADKANMGIATKKDKEIKPYVIPYCRFTKLIICYLGRKHNINQRSGSPFNMAEVDHRLGNLKFILKGKEDEVFGMQIPKELITDNIRNAP
ncbi:hypothetical protein Tco_1414808 [Tanacetum coccineum]